MKRISTFLVLIISVSGIFAQTTFFDFKVKDINGDSVDLSIYRGKKILVVNTASYCGYTPQYADLQDLWEQYGPDDFVILGFPSNDFGSQEPGSDEDIKDFCTSNYGVTFPMMSKIKVKGTEIHPLYNWLTKKSENGVMDAPVQWNFQKFMINPDGSLHGYVPSSTSPKVAKITSWIAAGTSIVEEIDGMDVYYSNRTLFIKNKENIRIDKIEVYDLKGSQQKVYSGFIPSFFKIDLSDLRPGLYMLLLESERGVLNRKFMVE
jgi:glutathione peroxidase